MNLELILSNHDKKCLTCVRSENCELQTLCKELGVENSERFAGARNEYKVDSTSDSIVRNNNKCILCRRCVGACANVQKVGVIGPVMRGFKTSIESPFNMKLGQMALHQLRTVHHRLPCGCSDRRRTLSRTFGIALADGTKHVVVQPAPAVRAALGEEFGMSIGTSVTGKMAAALRRLGFAKVFDTDFGADLTIMEEANELIDRVTNGGVLPMDHQLLSRLDQVLRALLSGIPAESELLQVSS